MVSRGAEVAGVRGRKGPGSTHRTRLGVNAGTAPPDRYPEGSRRAGVLGGSWNPVPPAPAWWCPQGLDEAVRVTRWEHRKPSIGPRCSRRHRRRRDPRPTPIPCARTLPAGSEIRAAAHRQDRLTQGGRCPDGPPPGRAPTLSLQTLWARGHHRAGQGE